MFTEDDIYTLLIILQYLKPYFLKLAQHSFTNTMAMITSFCVIFINEYIIVCLYRHHMYNKTIVNRKHDCRLL